MKKQYLNLLALPLILLMAGCYSIPILPHQFDETVQLPRFKEGVDTHIDSLINTNGYYAGAPNDSTYREHLIPFIFYRDATFEMFRFINEYPFLKMKNVYIPGKTRSWLSDIIMGGNYIIKGDTIVADMYYVEKSRWQLDRLYFKAVSRDTLLLFEKEKYITKKGKNTQQITMHQYYAFIPATLPKSQNATIRKKKWMWEDKEEWRRHKELTKPSWMR